MATYQNMLCNGTWIDMTPEQAEYTANKILERESWYAPRVHREPMTTVDEVLNYLATSGQSLSHGSDWYDQMRAKPMPRAPVETKLVKCDCGHSVAPINVMHASRGTSCPDCYDEMSN
jgi:hypothetical protein